MGKPKKRVEIAEPKKRVEIAEPKEQEQEQGNVIVATIDGIVETAKEEKAVVHEEFLTKEEVEKASVREELESLQNKVKKMRTERKKKTSLSIDIDKEFYTTFDIHLMTGNSIATVKNWTERGWIKGFKSPGGHWRIPKESLLEFFSKFPYRNPFGVVAKVEVPSKAEAHP